MRFTNLQQLAKGVNAATEGGVRSHPLTELNRAKWRFWNGRIEGGTDRTRAFWAMGAGRVFRTHSFLKEVGERALEYDSLPGVERRFHAQLWKALPCGTAVSRVCRIGRQRDCCQTNGEEATDEMEFAC